MEAVKQVYDDLKLRKMFKSYEEDSYNDILEQIGHTSGGSEKRPLNHDIFHSYLNRIYQRES